MSDYTNNNGFELSWDSEIENDGASFELLPDGDYDFVVDKFDRERYEGGAKLPACWKAVIHLHFTAPNGAETIVRHNLFLHSRCEGMLCAFFTAIGQRKNGQRIQMNWNAVPGSRGRARLGHREYNGNTYNEVKRFLDPPAAPVQQQWQQTTIQNPNGGYTPGMF